MTEPLTPEQLKDYVAWDTETFYENKYSLRFLNTWSYVWAEQFDCYMISVHNEEQTWVGHPNEYDWSFLHDKWILCHNATFDACVWNRMQHDGLIPEDIKPKGFIDTADMVSYLRCLRPLKKAREILLPDMPPLDKSIRDYMENKTPEEMKADGRYDDVLKYAADDAISTFELFKRYGHLWPEEERRISELNREAGWHGLQVDRDMVEAAVQQLKGMQWEAERDIPWEWDKEAGKTPLSLTLARMQCRKDNITAPSSFAKDNLDTQIWEDHFADKHPWIKAMRTWRRTNILLKKVETLLSDLRDDDTYPYQLKYYGAHCVSGDTEVLTKRGWMPIEDWPGGEIVQWDPRTCSARFGPATPNAFFNTEGSMIEVNAPFVKAQLTLGHTVPIFSHASNKLRAEGNKVGPHKDIQAADLLDRGSSYIPVSALLETSGTLDEDQMRLLVAVQADGHWADKGAGALWFTLRKSRKIERVKQLLEKLGLPYTAHEFASAPGQLRIVIKRRHCPEWLTPERKDFGAWLLDSSPLARVAFCEELAEWDGHRLKAASTHVEYGSAIRENVEWAITMAHLTGVYSATSIQEKQAKGNRQPYYRVGIRTRGEGRALVYRKHVTVASPVGTVYCPTTETGYWMCRKDGHIHITGNTGRYSGDARFNMQNLPRTSMFGVDIRAMFTARPGHKLILFDYSSIESVVRAWVVGDKESLDLFEKGMDAYEIHARKVHGWSDPEGRTLKQADPQMRTECKVEDLALGYQGGVGALKVWANAFGLNEWLDDEAMLDERKLKFRAANPKVVARWFLHRDDLFASVARKETLEVELPTGYTLSYYNPVRRDNQIWAQRVRGENPVKLYGGKIFENVVQAIARQVLTDSVIRLTDAGFKVLVTVHDEVILEVPEDEAELAFKKINDIMTIRPDWAPSLPLRVEGDIVDRYKK